MEAVDPQQAFIEILSSEKYSERLSNMTALNRSAFTLDFEDVLAYGLELAEALVNSPDEMLKHAERAAYERLNIVSPGCTVDRLFVRLSPLPEATPIREIGSKHIGKLVMVEGLVVRALPVQPLVVEAAFRCRACTSVTRVKQEGPFLRYPYACGNADCGRNGPFDFLENKSDYVDFQSLRMQEKPEELPPGQIPTHLDLRVVGSDLRGVAKPGDQARVVGVVRATAPLVPKAGRLRALRIDMEVNNVIPAAKEAEALAVTPEDEAKIRELASDPWVHRKLVQSIAPSLHGYEHVKEACLYLLLGGTPKRFEDINVRGDAHVLLVGDPATGKSQILQYIAKVAPRGLYTSGRGTTAAGLTASVVKSEKEGGLALEAGAVVLADKGTVAIDELDKIKPEDRVAIHTAMEQQVVSVAKGGIVATLNARASVLAAANPQFGRYVPERTVVENINLPPTILSRFDLIFILRDVPDREADAKVGSHVLSLHRMRTSPTPPPVSQELLKKYVACAKNIAPVLSEEAIQRLSGFYLKMREASKDSSMAITLRQLESMVRLAEARAKAALRDVVTAEDAEAAILIMTRCLQDVGIDTSTQKVDVDILLTGKPASLRDKMQVILGLVVSLQRDTGMIEKEVVVQEAEKRGMSWEEAERVVAQLLREGTLYEPRSGFLKKA